MKEPYLEVTFRKGRPMAAYLYLARRPGEKSYRTSTADPGLIIDLNRNEKPIGIEITAPASVTVAALNSVLNSFGLPPLAPSDLAPLQAA